MHVALVVDPVRVSAEAVAAAQTRAGKDGTVDIVLTFLPTDTKKAELIVRTLYEYSSGGPVPVNVLVNNYSRKEWDLVLVPQGTKFNSNHKETIVLETTTDLLAGPSTPSGLFDVVIVGGTFDHLHNGHKLLLTMSALIARHELIVGITGPQLLVNKKYAAAMDSYARREAAVRGFLGYVFPTLKVATFEINDIYGPTGFIEQIDALVVSQETSSGAGLVNKYRQEKGWHPLHVVEVGLIGGENKVSSTDLRREDLSKKASQKL